MSDITTTATPESPVAPADAALATQTDDVEMTYPPMTPVPVTIDETTVLVQPWFLQELEALNLDLSTQTLATYGIAPGSLPDFKRDSFP
ncbi:hypothetical protein AYX13_01202 [Cryptococcus neoformans]|nr:hypothetical protein AYX13_01202 [Cryptococcus neoformans var. grubii]